MTAASLEALARALAKLEPDVFALEAVKQHLILWHGDGDFIYQTTENEEVDDDRLFGAVRRCARKRNMFLSIHEAHNKKGFVRCNEWDGGESLEYIIDDQIGVALALAYCAALGEKVSV